MFTEALFTITKTQKQPKCLPRDEWINNMWYIQYIYNGVLVSNEKEENPAICSNMDVTTVREITQARKTNTV